MDWDEVREALAEKNEIMFRKHRDYTIRDAFIAEARSALGPDIVIGTSTVSDEYVSIVRLPSFRVKP